MRINNIWKELENDSSIQSGLLFRRFSGSVLPDIFVALKAPERLRCIATLISKEINPDVSSFDNLKDICVEIIPDERNINKNILLFKLLAPEHKDIYSVLCEDLITNISSETNERLLIKTLLNRFEKWKSLFTKIVSQGLSPEEQRGLFGELYFLRKFLQRNNDYPNVLNTWLGPASEVRDFQMNNWGLEVKTTHGNNHQKIQISSERQLDITHLERLYIYHISLEKMQEGGETLNQIVSSIKNLLIFDTIALNRFRSKLYEAGYFEKHTEIYDSTGYFIRQDTFYIVENDFPRIQENELRSGVGDIKYSIILSQCETFKQSEETVFQNLIQ